MLSYEVWNKKHLGVITAIAEIFYLNSLRPGMPLVSGLEFTIKQRVFPLEKLWGICKKGRKKLEAMNIQNCVELWLLALTPASHSDGFCDSLMSALTRVNILPMTSSFPAAGIPRVRLSKQLMVAWLPLEAINTFIVGAPDTWQRKSPDAIPSLHASGGCRDEFREQWGNCGRAYGLWWG